MIVVKITLHSAITGEIKEIGSMAICNDGSSEERNRGNYNTYVYRRGNFAGKPVRRGRVEDYPRLSYSVWRLVLRALRACYPEEK